MSSTAALLEELDRTKTRASNHRKKAAEKAEQILDVGGVIAGAAAAGYVDAKWPGKKLMGMGPNLALGVALTAVGIMDAAGKPSRLVSAVGSGMLGAEAYKFVYGRVSKGAQSAGVGAAPRQLHQPPTFGQLNDMYRDVARGRAAA